MTRIDQQSPAAQRTTTDHVQTCSEYKSPLAEYFADMNSSLPDGWGDSFTRVGGSGICVEDPKPDCITVGSAVASARQTLNQARENPWRLAYAGVESTFGPLSNSRFNSWFREDAKFKHRYEHVYQPFYFYDFGEEDFLRLRAHLFESLPLLDENTQSEVRKLFYLIDGILRHGRFDPSDVFFAAKVDVMAAVLSEMAADALLYRNNEIFFDEKLVDQSSALSQPTIDQLVNVLGNSLHNPESISSDQKLWGNVQILGLIDPIFKVPFYFPGDKCDLDRFSAFWDFLDNVLKGDFNTASAEEITRALDQALERDLGSEERFLDDPTKYVLGSIFWKLKYELSQKTFCEDPASSKASSEISGIVHTLDTAAQALFWAYNASDEREVAMRSRFNPEPFYAKPPLALRDILTVENLLAIASTSENLDYHDVQVHADALYDALSGLHFAIVDYGNPDNLENFLRDHWNGAEVLRIIQAAYPQLSEQAIETNARYPEPTFGIPQPEFIARVSYLKTRMAQRIVETETETALASLQNTLCTCCEGNHAKKTVLECLFKSPDELTPDETKTSQQALAKLRDYRSELLCYQGQLSNDNQASYELQLMNEVEAGILFAGDFNSQDRELAHLPNTYPEVAPFIKDKLFEISSISDPLFSFSSTFYGVIFSSSQECDCDLENLNLPEGFLTDSQNTLTKIQWGSRKEINLARLSVLRMKECVECVDNVTDTAEQTQLARFDQFLGISESILDRQLRRMV